MMWEFFPAICPLGQKKAGFGRRSFSGMGFQSGGLYVFSGWAVFIPAAFLPKNGFFLRFE